MSQFNSIQQKATSEQRPPVNNGHKFGVPRVVVVHRFDYTTKVDYYFPKGADQPLPKFTWLSGRSADEVPLLAVRFHDGDDVAVPESGNIAGLLAIGIVGAASTLKRKLKPSKSTEKATTKIG